MIYKVKLRATKTITLGMDDIREQLEDLKVQRIVYGTDFDNNDIERTKTEIFYTNALYDPDTSTIIYESFENKGDLVFEDPVIGGVVIKSTLRKYLSRTKIDYIDLT